MNKKKKLSFIIFLAMIPLSGTIASQYFAHLTKFNYALGDPVFYIYNYPVYFFSKILFWSEKFKTKTPVSLGKANSLGFFILILCAFSIFLLNRKKALDTTHGSADWANKEEIDKMGYFPIRQEVTKLYKESGVLELYKKNIKNNKELYETGVYIGRDQFGRDLIDMGPGHLIMVAKTGAGKGVGVVITTLLTWKGSVFVIDIKGENYQLTHKYRKSIGQKILRFDPSGTDSCGYNPLSEIEKGLFEYDQARSIASTLISPSATDKFFGPSAISFLSAVILFVLYTKKDSIATLTDVYNFITSEISLEEKLNLMKTGTHNLGDNHNYFNEIYRQVIYVNGEPSPLTHPIVSREGGFMAERADNERSGIISSTITELSIFISPNIARNTSKSDFKISDLMNDDVPISFYFVTPPSAIKNVAVIQKLLISQIIFKLTKEMKFEGTQNKDYKHKLLFLLDEFPAIGRMDLFHTAISFIRGYGMKALIIIQDLKQLNDIYGPNNSFFSNCSTSIFYGTNDESTAKLLETRLGNKTIQLKNTSYKNLKYLSDWNHSESNHGRPLLNASEVMTLDINKVIILTSNQKPIYGIKTEYYKDAEFMRRQEVRGYGTSFITLYFIKLIKFIQKFKKN